MSALALDAVAHELLDAAADSLQAILDDDPTLDGAPSLQYVSPGQPLGQCCDDGQLTVHTDLIGMLATGPIGAPAVSGRKVPIGAALAECRATITVLRCLPIGQTVGRTYTPATGAELEAAADQHNADGWALWNGILARIAAGVIFDGCANVTPETMIVLHPLGGCVGWTLPISFQLDRYTDDAVGT